MKQTSIFIGMAFIVVAGGLVACGKPRQSPLPPTTKLIRGNLQMDEVANPSKTDGPLMHAKMQELQPIQMEQEEAIAKKDYKSLELTSKKGISTYDKDSTSWINLAEAEENLKNKPEELRAYRALVYSKGWFGSINSGPTTHMKYVLALLRNNLWDEAAAVYNNAIPDDTTIFTIPLTERGFDSGRREFKRLQGMAHLYLGSHSPGYRPDRPGEILGHLQEAIKLQPGLALAHYAYGRQLAEENRPLEAKAAFQRALRFGDGDLKSKIKIQMRHM